MLPRGATAFDPQPVPFPVEGERLREREHRSLGSRIVGVLGNVPDRRFGGRVDDAAVVRRLEVGPGGLAHVDGAQVVEVDHAAELLVGHTLEPVAVPDAGVVDDDVNAAEGIERGLHDGRGAGLVGDVGEAGHSLPAGSRDLLGHLLGRLGR